MAGLRVLDTSVIIDGRVAEIVETGFLDGTLVVPQFVPRKQWHNLLHAQTALLLRLALLFRPGIVITILLVGIQQIIGTFVLALGLFVLVLAHFTIVHFIYDPAVQDANWIAARWSGARRASRSAT